MRNRQVVVRLSEQEWSALTELSFKRGLTTATLARMLLLSELKTDPPHANRASTTMLAPDEPFDFWSLKNIEYAFYDFYEGRSLADVRTRWELSNDQLRQIKAASSSPRALDMMRALGMAV